MALQGHIWAEGYARGELKATLFADVAPRIRAWTTASKPEEDKDGEGEGVAATKVMIYSSGSVAAQKLLFGHTDGEPADLNPLLSGYFDTVTAGPKTERASYEAILAKAETAVPAGEWLFLSDNVREVEAAKEAGMQSFVVDRPGNAPLSEEDRRRHRVITSFDEL
jgi:enolase-phosphatase E1